MSPYATELAHARLDALRTLVDALNEAETPDEKRRCAVAIFNAPDPCDLDDEIELEDDDGDDENEDSETLDADAQPPSPIEDNSAHEDAPLPTNPASTPDIRHHPSHTDPALLNRGEFDHLLSLPLAPSLPP